MSEKLKSIKEEYPTKYNLFKRANEGTASPREAIKVMCLECMWMDTKAIKECTATDCPLWKYRPFANKK